MTPTALVTGASSGLGRAMALELARRGHALVLTGRDEAQLWSAAQEAEAVGSPRVDFVVQDLSVPGGAEGLWQWVALRGLRPSVLVLAAGEGWTGQFERQPRERLEPLGRLLVTSALELASLFLAARPEGVPVRLVVMSSTAAFHAGPGSAVYYALKAALHRWAVALGQELRRTGVTVTVVCPGAVATRFSERAGKQGLPWARSPEFVARHAIRAMERGRRRLVVGWENRLLVLALRLLPESWGAALAARSQRPLRN